MIVFLSCLCAIFIILMGSAAPAQVNAGIYDLSLDELYKLRIESGASLTKTEAGKTPASVTLITREMIEESGARSLDELLEIYVPNYMRLRQSTGGPSFGLRGIISDQNQKTLVLVNGRVVNLRNSGQGRRCRTHRPFAQGVAGTLGAGELQQRAQGLEAAIREGQAQVEIDSHLTSVQEELDRLVNSIQEALGVETQEDQTNGEAEFDLSTVENLPELIEALEVEKARVEELCETLTINDIEAFASKMKAVGQDFGYGPLIAWSKDLAGKAEMFDLDGMSSALSGYGDLLARTRETTATTDS